MSRAKSDPFGYARLLATSETPETKYQALSGTDRRKIRRATERAAAKDARK